LRGRTEEKQKKNTSAYCSTPNPRRTKLEKLIYRFPKDLGPQEIRRIHNVDLITALSRKREVPQIHLRNQNLYILNLSLSSATNLSVSSVLGIKEIPMKSGYLPSTHKAGGTS
jgi:hypothetical protein